MVFFQDEEEEKISPKGKNSNPTNENIDEFKTKKFDTIEEKSDPPEASSNLPDVDEHSMEEEAKVLVADTTEESTGNIN